MFRIWIFVMFSILLNYWKTSLLSDLRTAYMEKHISSVYISFIIMKYSRRLCILAITPINLAFLSFSKYISQSIICKFSKLFLKFANVICSQWNTKLRSSLNREFFRKIEIVKPVICHSANFTAPSTSCTSLGNFYLMNSTR